MGETRRKRSFAVRRHPDELLDSTTANPVRLFPYRGAVTSNQHLWERDEHVDLDKCTDRSGVSHPGVDERYRMRARGNFCLEEPITVQLVNVRRTKVAINLSDLGAIDEDVEDAIFSIWAPEDLDETAGECP
jgi:hypothetical protein